MKSQRRVICVIPARLASTRLPKKICADLCGKSLLQRVYERAITCSLFDEVLIAVDSEEVASLVDGFSGQWVMTSASCASGTHRLLEVRKQGVVQGDVWVNWQADEPFITSEMIQELLQGVDQGEKGVDQGEKGVDREEKGVDREENCLIWTLKKRLLYQEWQDPNVVKVLTTRRGRALIFSRQPIPYDRAGEGWRFAYKHVGLYAYADQALKMIATLEVSPLAQAESLEQLTFLENGLPIQLYETQCEPLGIDTPEDLCRAAARIAQEEEGVYV